MKFGKNLQFWLRILVSLIHAIIHHSSANPGPKTELGPVLVNSLLDQVAKLNDDDKAVRSPEHVNSS